MTAIKATLKTKEPKPKTQVVLKLSEDAARDLMAILNHGVEWSVGVGPTAEDTYFALKGAGLSSGDGARAEFSLTSGRKQLRITR